MSLDQIPGILYGFIPFFFLKLSATIHGLSSAASACYFVVASYSLPDGFGHSYFSLDNNLCQMTLDSGAL